MEKNFLLYLAMLFVVASCDPPRDCTSPKCADSPIFVKLKASLSDTNKVLHVGDTLKMSLRIPDTLATNQGTYYLSSVQKAYISLDYYQVDTIISKSNFTINREKFLIKKGQFAPKSTVVEVEYATKMLELHFVLSKKGHYSIQISPQSGRLEITEKDGTQYLIMSNVGFNVKDSHNDLYLSWIGDAAYRAEAKEALEIRSNSGFGWYFFNVE